MDNQFCYVLWGLTSKSRKNIKRVLFPDTRLGAHGDADDVMRWEHWTGRSLLIDRGALLSNPYLILTLFIEPIDAAKFSRATSCMLEESKTTASFEMVKFVSNATGT